MQASYPFVKRFNIYKWLPCLALATIVLLTVWFFRWTFFENFDPNYLEDYYTHSQWAIPLSSRVMGDSPLYQFSGYKILQGADLFSINPEAPPFGKYLYGVAGIWFNNVYLGSWLMYGLAIVFYWLVLKHLPISRSIRWTSILFFGLSPILINQLSGTLLDLPQLVFLLGHLLAILQIKSSGKVEQKLFWLILASVWLGLMSATKIALFLPLVLILDAWYLWQIGLIFYLPFLILFTGLTYLLTYLPFFLNGHNVIDWLKTQKWMVDFFAKSEAVFNPFITLTTITTGWFKGWWNEGWSFSPDWNLVWPLGLISSLVWLKNNYHQFFRYNSDPSILYFYGVSLLILISYFFIPFWPRYVLLTLPFLALISAEVLNKLAIHWKIIFWMTILWTTVTVWRPSPDASLQLFAESWSIGAAGEMYDLLDSTTKTQISRKDWTSKFQSVLIELQTENSTVSAMPVRTLPWQNVTDTPISVEYLTPVGSINHQPTLKLVRHNNKWQVSWDWKYLLPDYSTDDAISAEIIAPEISQLITSDNQIVAELSDWPSVYVTIDEVQSWENISNIRHSVPIGIADIYGQIHAMPLSKREKFISPLNFYITKSQADKINELSGLSVKHTNTLTPVETFRKTSAWLVLSKWWPSTDLLAQKVGSIKLIKSNGQTTVLVSRLDQQSIMLPLTLAELKIQVQDLTDVSPPPSE